MIPRLVTPTKFPIISGTKLIFSLDCVFKSVNITPILVKQRIIRAEFEKLSFFSSNFALFYLFVIINLPNVRKCCNDSSNDYQRKKFFQPKPWVLLYISSTLLLILNKNFFRVLYSICNVDVCLSLCFDTDLVQIVLHFDILT